MPGFLRPASLGRRRRRGEEGHPLIIIEAMKMENEIRAECAGVVAEIAVAERQTVNNGDVLVRISEADAPQKKAPAGSGAPRGLVKNGRDQITD